MGAVARQQTPHQLDLLGSDSKQPTLLRAMQKTPAARRRQIREETGCSSIAHARIVEFALELRTSNGWDRRGWIRLAADYMGIKANTLQKIVRNDYGRVGLRTVERISQKCGIEPSLFLDPDI